MFTGKVLAKGPAVGLYTYSIPAVVRDIRVINFVQPGIMPIST